MLTVSGQHYFLEEVPFYCAFLSWHWANWQQQRLSSRVLVTWKAYRNMSYKKHQPSSWWFESGFSCCS